MSKRKRAPKPPAEDSSDDDSTKDDMVHVTPDLLSGGSDMFSARKAGEPEAGAEAEAAPPTEADPEPAVPEPAMPEPVVEDVQPTEASTTLSHDDEPVAAPPPEPAPAPSTPPPPYVPVTTYAPRQQRRGGSGAALGVVLVVLGVFALVIALTGFDLTQNGWPLFILIPGLTLLVAGFISFGSVATVPGGIVTMLGVVLAVTNSTGHWAVLTYAWALVVPFGVGLGIYLQALRDRDQSGLRSGRTLLFIGFMIFLIGFVVFESILGISGRDTFGPLSKAALPVLLIIVGVMLFVRSLQQSRRT